MIAGEKVEIEWDEQAMLGVVVAANGYPEQYDKGAVLRGLDKVAQGLICVPCWYEKRRFW